VPKRRQVDALGPQDLVVVAGWQPAMAAVARGIARSSGARGATAMNGVPWWFFQGFGGEHAACAQSVDADGSIARHSRFTGDRLRGARHLLTPEPGLVKHGFGRGLILGSRRAASRRAHRAGRALPRPASGARPRRSSATSGSSLGQHDHEPISAITGATCDRILDDSWRRERCA
jgi:2-dehydropantoate 2-reductase